VTSFPAVKGKDLIAALRGQGFTVIRIKGSHHFIRHTDGRATVVPVHAGETLGPGLLASPNERRPTNQEAGSSNLSGRTIE